MKGGWMFNVWLLTGAGCEINGKCVAVGGTVVDDCRTLTCTEEDLNGLRVLNIKPTQIREFTLPWFTISTQGFRWFYCDRGPQRAEGAQHQAHQDM